MQERKAGENVLPDIGYHMAEVLDTRACAELSYMCARMRDTAVVRVSDDFYPRNPASSYPHIAACAYNGFFLSAIMHVSPL